MIDAVITWVDGSDPKHRKKRFHFIRKEDTEGLKQGANRNTRFANNNELWYCMHLIRKNAKWINRIFLVTDNQQPDWLNYEKKKDLGVIVVDHKEIFRGFEDCLPTFNATSIETMLFQIPDLSEKFLYFNDDIFLIRPTQKNDYFLNNRILIRGRWVYKNPYVKKVLSYLFQPKKREGYVGTGRNRKYFPNSHRIFVLAHSPHPINKHILGNLFSTREKLKINIKHRFRKKNQYHTIGLASNIAFKQKKAKRGPDDWGYVETTDYTSNLLFNKLKHFDTNNRIKSVCIQSLDLASSDQQAAVCDFLEAKL